MTYDNWKTRSPDDERPQDDYEAPEETEEPEERARAVMSIGYRMIAERQREIAVSIKALRMMQEYVGNPFYSFKCVTPDEEKAWYAKAEALIPPVGDAS